MGESSEAGGQPPPPPKPRLKINVSRSNSMIQDVPQSATAASTAQTPIPATPSGEAPRRVKLKISASIPSTPANENPPKIAQPSPVVSTPKAVKLPAPAPPAEKPAKTKAGRQPKPTQKLVESKKRRHDDDDDDDAPLATSRTSQSHAVPARIIKIRQTPKSAPTQLVVKPRGRPPHHPPGDGYDSEASDRELDPAIEEQFILRMLPGEHCDYIRWCMENGKLGVHKSQGGADLHMKFFEEDTRRAMIVVKGQPYAAVMVDLPTITETMKTWDRKQFMKSADICQMLLVFQKVKDEAEARRAELPKIIDSNFKWPHGITPPMHDCIHRRFAKTISRKEIEDKEAEVERLLAEDAKAATTKWEWVDDRLPDADDEDMIDEDAEGEVDDSIGYFGADPSGYDEMDNNELEADLEAAFADDLAETPVGTDMNTPAVDTPAAALQPSIEMDGHMGGLGEDGEGDDEDDDEDDDDDDDDDDEDEDLDDDQRAERDEHQAVLSMIKDLEKQMGLKQAELEKTQNRILRTRIEQQIKQLKSELDLKKGSIGMENDD